MRSHFGPGQLLWFTLLAALAIPTLTIPAWSQTAPNETVERAMQEGGAAMKSGDFTRAVASFTVVTHAQPAWAEGFLNLGLAEERTGQLERARADLEKSIHLKPTLRGANLFLGTIAYRQNRFKDAERYLIRETQLDPSAAKAFMWLGVCRLAEDEPEAAIAPLDKAHQLDPTDVDTLYHRGRAYLLVANASYAKMFKLDPDSVRVHEVLGEADAAAFRTAEAITQFEIAVKTAPRQSGLHENLADQYWISGDLDKAAVAYKAELEIDPANTVARFKLGSLEVVHGKAAEGVPLLQQALREDPSLSDAHYYLGNGLLDIDRNEDAVKEFLAAIAADPGNDRAISSYYRLSQAYRKLHRTDEARVALANYQQLKAQAKARQETRTAQIVRKRSELPVDIPEQIPE